jgi:uncharacterized Fe-S cluster-containing radical SAM superfamily protein
MNGLRKCGIYTQWNFIQPYRRMKFCWFAGKWMEPENILSEVIQVQKTKGCMYSLICGIWTQYKCSNIMKNKS